MNNRILEPTVEDSLSTSSRVGSIIQESPSGSQMDDAHTIFQFSAQSQNAQKGKKQYRRRKYQPRHKIIFVGKSNTSSALQERHEFNGAGKIASMVSNSSDGHGMAVANLHRPQIQKRKLEGLVWT